MNAKILGSLALRTLILSLIATVAFGQTKPRARDLGVPFDGTPGAFNAITDVKGVEVGHTTLISGSGKLKVGEGPVRTGVTAVLPRGKASKDPVFGGWFTLNGNGEMTGTTWLEELIGLAESDGDGLALAKEIYAQAYDHREELCAPYVTVIDIDPAKRLEK